MTDTYPPFSGDDPTCTACGFVGARTTYIGFGECIHPAADGFVSAFAPNPRLCRECKRCGRQWDEAPITPNPEAAPPSDAKGQPS